MKLQSLCSHCFSNGGAMEPAAIGKDGREEGQEQMSS